MDTRAFLELVLPERDIYVLHIARGNVRYNNNYDTLDDVCEAIESLDATEATVYFAVGKFANNLERNDKTGRMAAKRKKKYATCFRSLCVDVDVGEGHKYSTQTEAAKDLYRASVALGLPLPMLVDSGSGVHGYWPMDRDVKADTWERMSVALRRALESEGVDADWSKIHDTSMVLRPAGAHHKKDPKNWRLVRVVKEQPVTDALVLAERLQPYKGDAPKPKSEAGKKKSAMLAAVLEGESNPIKLDDMKKCQQIAAVLESGGVENAAGAPVEEPMWRAMLGIAKFCESPEDAALRLGGAHPEFDLDENLEKMEKWEGTGPTTCGFLENLCPSGCNGCEFKGKIKTPASITRAPKETVTAKLQTTEAEPFPYTSIKIKGYSFSGDWLVYTPPGSEESTPVCKYHMFVVGAISNNELNRQLITIAVRVPVDGVPEDEWWTTVEIPMDIIAKGGGDLAAAFSNRNAYIPTDMQPVRKYLMTYLAELRRTKALEFSCAHYGWQPDGSFLGTTGLIGPTVSKSVHLDGLAKGYSDSITQAGSLDLWVKATKLFDQPELDYHGLVMLMMLGAPLFEAAGVPSALVNCYSRDSGSGKTTVGLFGLSAYGNPTALMRTVNDTHNSLYKFLGTMRNFGFYLDEITTIEPHALRDLVYTLPEGREKERLGRDADSFRALAHWRTPAFSSSNRDLYEAISQRISAEGERYRILQFPFDRTSVFANNPKVGYTIYRTITQNYGHAGPIVTQKIIDAGGPQVVYDAAEAEFHEKYGFQFLGPERYYQALFIVAHAIGKIAAEAGIILYDYEAAIRKGLAYILSIRDQFAGEVMGGLDVIEQFMTEHANDMLEAQNDAVIDQLYETASQIKSYSQTINRQAKEQNDLLNGMGTQMDKTQGLLGSTLKKMQAMAAQGGAKHMCYMVLFVLFMLWLLYWVAFTKRTVGPPVEVPALEDAAGDGLDGGR